MYGVELYGRVRLAVLRDGMSQREAARRFGIDRGTVARILKHSTPPGYTRVMPVRRPKLADHVSFIERLRDERGYDGGYSAVRDYLRPRRLARKEAFIPLTHPPGHAQADFGEAVAILGGIERKVRFFVMDLPQSDAIFVKAYHAETAEACLATGTSRPSPSSAACRCRSCTTAARSPWPRSWETGPASASHAVRRSAVPPPLRGPLRPSGEGERQGQGRGDGRLRPPELSGPDPAGARHRRAERAPSGALSGAPAGRAAGREGFDRRPPDRGSGRLP